MARTISVEILGDASSLERAFKKSSRAGSKFQRDVGKTHSKTSRAFGGMRRSVLGLAGGFVGVYGLTSAVKTAFSEMSEAQQVSAQTAAALKSTGAAANVTAKHVDALGTQLLNLSGVDDEAIRGAENLLLTFTSIRDETGKGNKIFDEATKAALDLSVRFKKDLGQSAIIVGKALNDPIKGITALSRIGVQFTEQQKDQIKTLVKSGDVLGAQKVILAELRKETGGAAAAAGKTFAGRWNLLIETLKNLSAEILRVLLPTITKAVNVAVKWLQNSKNQKQVLDTVKAAAQALSTAVRALSAGFKILNSITGSTKRSFEVLLGLFVGFKALKLGLYLAGMTKQMRAFGAASAAANASNLGGGVLPVPGGGKAGKLGRFGRLARFGRAIPIAGQAIAIEEIMRNMPHPKELDKPGYRIIGDAFGRALHGAARPRVLAPAGARGAMTINGGVHLHGVQNVRQMENELARRRKARAQQRRGAR